MKKSLAYSVVQIKCVMRVMPRSMCITLLLGCCIFLMAAVVLYLQEHSEEKTKVTIGLVGDLEESYLGFGIRAIKALDSSRFTIDFIELDEQEAIKKLEQGELKSYIKVPEGFLESILRGELEPLLYVSPMGNQMLSGMIVNEVVKAVSLLMRDTQNAVFAMQDYIKEQGFLSEYSRHTNAISIRYLDFILDRPSVFALEQLGISGNQSSMQAYYVCSFSVLFLLLWGMVGCPIFIKRDIALIKMLQATGQKAVVQVVGEWIAYVIFMFGNIVVLFLLFAISATVIEFTLPEWSDSMIKEIICYAISFLPVLLLISSFQMLLFEVSSEFVSGILLQFLCAIGLGYLSGCFYPISFFPKSIEILANVLPTKIAIDYLSQTLLSQSNILPLASILGYMGFFLLWTVVIRQKKVSA